MFYEWFFWNIGLTMTLQEFMQPFAEWPLSKNTKIIIARYYAMNVSPVSRVFNLNIFRHRNNCQNIKF